MKKTTSLTIALLFTALATGSANAQTSAPANDIIWEKIAGTSETKADICVDKKLNDAFNNDVVLPALKNKKITRTIRSEELQKIKSNCVEKTGEPVEKQKFLRSAGWTIPNATLSITPAQ